MFVCVSSVRGAPGVSSWSLLLAAAWPHHAERVLVEADGTGGVIGARYDLPVSPGVVDLVSGIRRGSFDAGFRLESVARMLRQADQNQEGLWAVPAPLASHEAQAAWANLAKSAADAMAGDGRLWVADCGRVWAGSPIELLITTATLNVVITDDSIPSLVALQTRVRAMPGPVALIVVGKTKHSEEELANFSGANQVWRVPSFGSLAERAGVLASDSRRGRRGKVWQTGLSIAHELNQMCQTIPQAPIATDASNVVPAVAPNVAQIPPPRDSAPAQAPAQVADPVPAQAEGQAPAPGEGQAPAPGEGQAPAPQAYEPESPPATPQGPEPQYPVAGNQ